MLPARCEADGHEFDPLTGGICTVCRRLLCGWHLRGWRDMLPVSRGTGGDVCTECRKAGRTAGGTAGGTDTAR